MQRVEALPQTTRYKHKGVWALHLELAIPATWALLDKCSKPFFAESLGTHQAQAWCRSLCRCTTGMHLGLTVLQVSRPDFPAPPHRGTARGPGSASVIQMQPHPCCQPMCSFPIAALTARLMCLYMFWFFTAHLSQERRDQDICHTQRYCDHRANLSIHSAVTGRSHSCFLQTFVRSSCTFDICLMSHTQALNFLPPPPPCLSFLHSHPPTEAGGWHTAGPGRQWGKQPTIASKH